MVTIGCDYHPGLWMWRQGLDYGQMQKLGSHAGELGNRDGM
jgi:hypothetical protein